MQGKPFFFRRRASETPPDQEDRRGSARDRYGNWYWDRPRSHPPLVLGRPRAGQGDLLGRRRAPGLPVEPASPPPGAFAPLVPPPEPTPWTLCTLAVTDDHYCWSPAASPPACWSFDLRGGRLAAAAALARGGAVRARRTWSRARGEEPGSSMPATAWSGSSDRYLRVLAPHRASARRSRRRRCSSRSRPDPLLRRPAPSLRAHHRRHGHPHRRPGADRRLAPCRRQLADPGPTPTVRWSAATASPPTSDAGCQETVRRRGRGSGCSLDRIALAATPGAPVQLREILAARS